MRRNILQTTGLLVLSIGFSPILGLAQQPAATADDLQVQKLDTKAGMHAPKAIFEPEATYSDEARKKTNRWQMHDFADRWH